ARRRQIRPGEDLVIFMYQNGRMRGLRNEDRPFTPALMQFEYPLQVRLVTSIDERLNFLAIDHGFNWHNGVQLVRNDPCVLRQGAAPSQLPQMGCPVNDG